MQSSQYGVTDNNGMYDASGNSNLAVQFYVPDSATSGTAYIYIDSDSNPTNGTLHQYSEDANGSNVANTFENITNGGYHVYSHIDTMV